MSVLTCKALPAGIFLCGSELARDDGGASNIDATDNPTIGSDYYQINQQCLSKPGLFAINPTP